MELLGLLRKIAPILIDAHYKGIEIQNAVVCFYFKIIFMKCNRNCSLSTMKK